MDFTTAYRSAAENADDARTRQLALNLAAVHERIDAAVTDSGREDRPQLIVVTKYFSAADVKRLYDLGVRDVGENKDQEAAAKATEVADLIAEDHAAGASPSRASAAIAHHQTPLRWHFVGQLQSNKAKSVVRYAHSVHSADRAKVIRALNSAAAREADEGLPNQPLEVLLQVDLRSPLPDDGRGGAAPTEVMTLAELVDSSEHLHLGGLMAVAPLDEHPEPAFTRLQELSQLVSHEYPQATQVSAGMSQDLEAAVSFGATRLRIGRDVLGERPRP